MCDFSMRDFLCDFLVVVVVSSLEILKLDQTSETC